MRDLTNKILENYASFELLNSLLGKEEIRNVLY